jgi:hypothetical protein
LERSFEYQCYYLRRKISTKMKQIIFFFLASVLMGGCDHSHNQQAVDPNAAPTQEFYGQEFDLKGAIPVSGLSAALQGKDTLETVIEGVINQTCPNAGCWFDLKLENGELLKVTTDHVFFVPIEGCEGLKAVVKGKAYEYERSVEDQKHFAMEEGKSEEEIAKITEPLKLVAFTATGAMIEGYKETADAGSKPASCNHDHSGEEGHDHDHEHEGAHEHTEGSK